MLAQGNVVQKVEFVSVGALVGDSPMYNALSQKTRENESNLSN